MSFLPCVMKPKKKYHKFGLIDMFRQKIKSKQTQESTISSSRSKQLLKPRGIAQQQKLTKFVNQLAQQKVSYEQIQKLAWNGIPHCLRPKIWKYLLKYALIQETQQTLNKKRQEYQKLVKNYWKSKEQLSQENFKVYCTIEGDVKRIGAQFNDIFKAPQIQHLLKRMLYIWHMRHPASGYVQGMCDITNPFLTVFLSQYLPFDLQKMQFYIPIQNLSSDTLFVIEADIYWCVSKMLEYVVKNYTHGFGGQHQAYSKVQQLLYKIDQQLYQHLLKQKIDLFAFSFRCISTMLLRMFDPLVGIRLFDTFIAYEEEYPTLMIYLIIGILQKFAQKMLKMKGDQLMGYLHKLPTKTWQEYEIEIVIAQAYTYKKIFT